MEPQRTAAATLPPPPAFARGRGHTRRRYHNFCDENVIDLRRLDKESNINNNNTSNINTSSSCNSSSSITTMNSTMKTSTTKNKTTTKTNTPNKNTTNITNNTNNNKNKNNSTPISKNGHTVINNINNNNGGIIESFAIPSSQVQTIDTNNYIHRRDSTSSGYESPSKILDFLFIGGVRDATNAEFLKRENIKIILNISREEYWSVDRSVVVHLFPVDDTTDANIQQFFHPTFILLEQARKAYYEAQERYLSHNNNNNTINNNNNNNNTINNNNNNNNTINNNNIFPRVLVHCQRGRSRSATIVLAYLIERNGWTVAEALEYVARRRPRVEPNLAFMDALRAHQERTATRVRTRRCRALCLAVRHLPRDTCAAFVHKFFEDYVGCVREVMLHAASTNNTNNDNTNNNDNTLCLVFFAAAECVKVAKRLYMQQPQLFQTLGVIPGKALRLSIPTKLIRIPRGASTAECNNNNNNNNKERSASNVSVMVKKEQKEE